MGQAEHNRAPREPILRLGISTCLLGENVRFDGGHKRDPFLTDILGQYVTWVPVCPEVEMGMSIPRESIRLEGDAASPRLVGPKSGTDYTQTMHQWSQSRLEELAALDLHGYVLKKNSPSCGLFRVRVYNEHGMPQRNGRGLYAQALVMQFPLLPVEEEGRLNDMGLRENFIERVFAYYRWTHLLEEEPSPGGLVRFHTAHKLTLMAHSPSHYQQMGRLVAQAGNLPWSEVAEEYGQLFMTGLKVLGTTGKHSNVLQHLMGFLKNHLDKKDKAELVGLIEDYRRGLVPLVVPLTLLQHHLRRYPVPDWVHQQVYLSPYPKELMLRNHV